ncbi:MULTISPECIES: hypothetical protein [Candidatus Nitrosocaldus]|jgi:hypothetical protein|nr:MULTISPECIES: hypothetical protein [Candidatus Nitrosocaldus]
MRRIGKRMDGWAKMGIGKGREGGRIERVRERRVRTGYDEQ